MNRGKMRDLVWVGLVVLAALCGGLFGFQPSIPRIFAVIATGVLAGTWYECGRSGGDHDR